ncbi:MAG: Hint domain-containing protein, partial [Janthinobacterium lividum]
QTAAGTYVATGTAAQINADLAAASFTDTRASGTATDTITLADTATVAATNGASLHPALTTVSINVTQPAPAPCYASGTLILTDRGEVVVEALVKGDMVVTASGALRPIRWLGHRRVDCARHPDPDSVRPVRVRAHAFGPGVPRRDLVLSPEHALFLDGMLVPVRALVDGLSIVQEAWERVTYHHVELDSHDVLLAEGLAAESYLDTGNRAQFANNPLVALHASFGPGTAPAEPCAPLLVNGPRLEMLRDTLHKRAQARAA